MYLQLVFFPHFSDKFKYSSHSKQQLVFPVTTSIRKCMQ